MGIDFTYSEVKNCISITFSLKLKGLKNKLLSIFKTNLIPESCSLAGMPDRRVDRNNVFIVQSICHIFH